MRVHASATGATLEEALAKMKAELAIAVRHLHEVVLTEIAGQKLVDPEKQRIEHDAAKQAQLATAVRAVGGHVKAAEGQLVRVLVVVNDDSSASYGSYGRVEVDLVRA